MKHLFFALWPDDMTRQRCVQVQSLLPIGNHSCVQASNLHVTLVYIGSVDSATERALLQAAAALAVPEMRITFDRLSFWEKPAVLCLTGQNCNAELSGLVEQLTAIAQQLAITLDARPYKPHVTLAKKAKQALTVDFEPIVWCAHAFCLVESCSLAGGVQYRVCQSWGAC